MSKAPARPCTPEEYLEFERAAEAKHEFYAGQIFAMAGASFPHVRIVSHLMMAFGARLENTPCLPLCNDLRVRTPSGLYTYPDVLVVCGEPELSDTRNDTLLNPQIVIEVLSPSTENYDRGNRFDHYRTILALKEYILVAQDRPQVVQFARQPNQIEWLSSWHNGLEDILRLKSISCDIPLGDIYRQIDFPEDLPLLRPHDPHDART
jgi:Uma2 family endonuclease